MKNKFHGVFSITLTGTAFAIAMLAVSLVSSVYGFLYIALLAVSLPVMLYSYCAKCTCGRNDCSHVFIGKLLKYFPQRQGEYKLPDYLGIIIPFLLLIGFPQYFLFKFPPLAIAFWVLLAVAVTEILLFVCPRCGNKLCALCGKAEPGQPRR